MRDYRPFHEAVTAFLSANGWKQCNKPGEVPRWRHPARPRLLYAPGDAVCETPILALYQNRFVQHVTIITQPALIEGYTR